MIGKATRSGHCGPQRQVIVMAYIVIDCIVIVCVVIAYVGMAYVLTPVQIDKVMWNRLLSGQCFPTICGLPGLDNVALIEFGVQSCIILQGSWVA